MKKIFFTFLLVCSINVLAVVYNVGPSQNLTSLNSVPWESLNPGDSVNIYYSPTPYASKFVICRQGTQQNPIRFDENFFKSHWNSFFSKIELFPIPFLHSKNAFGNELNNYHFLYNSTINFPKEKKNLKHFFPLFFPFIFFFSLSLFLSFKKNFWCYRQSRKTSNDQRRFRNDKITIELLGTK